jgi:hypothetical protein
MYSLDGNIIMRNVILNGTAFGYPGPQAQTGGCIYLEGMSKFTGIDDVFYACMARRSGGAVLVSGGSEFHGYNTVTIGVMTRSEMSKVYYWSLILLDCT